MRTERKPACSKLKKERCTAPCDWHVGKGCRLSDTVTKPKKTVPTSPPPAPEANISCSKLKKAKCDPPCTWTVGKGCKQTTKTPNSKALAPKPDPGFIKKIKPLKKTEVKKSPNPSCNCDLMLSQMDINRALSSSSKPVQTNAKVKSPPQKITEQQELNQPFDDDLYTIFKKRMSYHTKNLISDMKLKEVKGWYTYDIKIDHARITLGVTTLSNGYQFMELEEVFDAPHSLDPEHFTQQLIYTRYAGRPTLPKRIDTEECKFSTHVCIEIQDKKYSIIDKRRTNSDKATFGVISTLTFSERNPACQKAIMDAFWNMIRTRDMTKKTLQLSIAGKGRYEQPTYWSKYINRLQETFHYMNKNFPSSFPVITVMV